MAKKIYTGYNKLPLGKIKPEGWLRRQLELQAKGLTGNLHKLWDNVSDKSAWLGGDGDGSEDFPIYLSGLIRLAYLLDDQLLKEKVEDLISKIHASIDADNNFGPKTNKEWWPRTAALNALITYAEATDNNSQIIPFLRNYFKYHFNELDNQPLYRWSAARAYEELIPLEYLYDVTGDEMVLSMIEKLSEQTIDWFKCYKKFKYRHHTSAYLSKGMVRRLRKKEFKHKKSKKQNLNKSKILKNNTPFIKRWMLTNGVNNAMAVKYPVLYNEFVPTEGAVALSKKTVQNLLKYHGTAVGVFTSDEQLDGKNPTKGISMDTVIEFMRSLEILLEKTGDPYYADLLELVAFNALPAMTNSDYTAHQAMQQVNQIKATNEKRDFFNATKDAVIYGVTPNHGIGTARMNQGFPRFTESLCFTRKNELAFMVYAPCTIETEIGNTKIKLKETTDYPFKNEVKLSIEALSGNPEVKFSFRVPKYTSLVITFNGEEVASGDNGILSVEHQIAIGDEFILKFATPLTLVNNPDKSVSVRRGSLLMATKLKTRHKIMGVMPYCDNEFYTITQWRTAPELEKKALIIKNEIERPVPEKPFDETCPPIEIEYSAKYVMNWEDYKNSADTIPKKPQFSQETFVRYFVPYGSTRIRIAQHPNHNKWKI